MGQSDRIEIQEVGPRDGLQNEATPIAADKKVAFIAALARAGLRRIEATSFVRPGVIAQLSDAAEVYRAIPKTSGCIYSALVPNRRGMETALECGVQEVAVFTAASESFTKRNINCTIEESFLRFADVFELATAQSVKVRGYVSTVVDCPYEGPIAPERVAEIAGRLLDSGCYEVSLGETIGTAVPDDVARLLDAVLKLVPADKLAGHFHDTRGTALANVARSLDYGLRVFDSSAAGLGGCPYAPGAAGNLATEDLVYFLERSGFSTGVDLPALVGAAGHVLPQIGRASQSRVHQAELSRAARTLN